jgi:hypothetical protein
MDQDIPNQATANARAAANPPKVVELFKTPEGLSPAWQAFFDKVSSYYERQYAAHKDALSTMLATRSWTMEKAELCEFEMLASAQKIKIWASEFSWNF